MRPGRKLASKVGSSAVVGVGTTRRHTHPMGAAPRDRAVLMLGLGVCCMGALNATLGFMMLGERGDKNRAKIRAYLDKPKPTS